jgi:hypothetical protein
VLAVPNWFPKAHVSFDWQRLQGRAVSVVVVLRGTMQVRLLLLSLLLLLLLMMMMMMLLLFAATGNSQ